MRRWRRTLGIAVVLIALQVALLALYHAYDAARERRPETVRGERVRSPAPAPALRLERPDGGVEIVEFGSDRPMLVHFWATWCPPCREELPRLLDLSNRLERSGHVRVVAVAADPGWSAVREFLRGRIPAQVLRDPDGRASRAFGVTDLPDSYLVGPDGAVRWRFAGAQDWRTFDVAAYLRE